MPTEKTEQTSTEKEAEVLRSPLAGGSDAGAGDQGPASDQKPTRPERPAGLADDFWNDETGVDLTKLTASYKELSDFKANQEKAKGELPVKPEDYKVALPEGFELPGGAELEVDESDPRLAPARELAHRLGLSQSGFSELIALDFQAKQAEAAHYDTAIAKEREALGTNGKARVAAVTDWLKHAAGNEGANALLPMMFTAKQVKAFESIIKAAGGSNPNYQAGAGEDGGESEISDEEYDAMSATQRVIYTRSLQAKKAQKG